MTKLVLSSDSVYLSREAMRELGSDGQTVCVWTHLAFSVAKEDGETMRFNDRDWILRRGQTATGDRHLAGELGTGRAVIRRCIAKLESLGFLSAERSKDGTLITLMGVESDHDEPPPTTPDHARPPKRSDHLRPPGKPALRVVQAASEKSATTSMQGRVITGVLVKIATLLSTRERATVRREGGGRKVPIPPPIQEWAPEQASSLQSDPIAEIVLYAGEKLGRSISSMEVMRFQERWRELPSWTVERIKQELDWLAWHPMARKTTYSISRVFTTQKPREDYARGDEEVCALIGEGLRCGRSPAEIAAGLVSRMPSCDPATVRAWVVSHAERISRRREYA